MSVNKVILVGHMGRDPESRRTASQSAVCNFSIATNERRKDASGNWTDQTEWHRVVAFGKQAEFCEKYLSKGRLVYVEGALRTNKWKDKEGHERTTTEILANIVQALGGRGGAGEASAGASEGGMRAAPMSDSIPQSVAPDEVPFDDDDIPF